MKKKTWMVLIYSSVIVLGLALFLIFFPKNVNETPKNTTTSSDTSQEEASPSTNPPTAQTYATKLTLNCARQVIISIGTELELLSNYISVEPSNLINNVSVEITPKNNASATGVSFSNNKIIPNSAGIYNVKFSIPKSTSNNLSDTLVVTVIAQNQDARITQIKDKSTLDEVVALNNLFTIDESIDSVTISTNDYISFSNNSIKGKMVGNTTLKLKLIDSYFCYAYSFEHEIKNIPDYTIVIEEENNGIVEFTCNIGETVYVNYAVYDKNFEKINQNITAATNNSNIAAVTLIEEPLVYIQCKAKGSCKLTIKSVLPDVEDKVVTLIFK